MNLADGLRAADRYPAANKPLIFTLTNSYYVIYWFCFYGTTPCAKVTMCAFCIPCASPGRPRPTPYKPVESVRLAPARSSTSLPFLSSQSLTNCPICKPFVLTFIQNAGVWGVPHLFSPPNNSASSPLRISVFSAFLRYLFPLSFTSHQSRITSHGFQTFRRRRILLHFSRRSRTKIASVILSPS